MKYIFADSKSLIKELEVVNPANHTHGIISTPENMTAVEAAKIKQDIVQNGYKVLAGEHEGKPVLKIEGFDSANNLLASIADDGAIKGNFTATKTALDEHKADKSDMSKLRLLGAGACFAVASSAILAAGAIRQSAGEAFQGFAGIVPAIGLMWASQQTAESQMSYLYRDFKEFAQENNLRIGNDVRAIITEREAPDDLFHNFQRGVFENGPAANNLIKAIAISSGTIGAAQQGNWYKTAGNALAVTGLLTANALPEAHTEHQSSVHLGDEADKKAGEISEPPTPKKGFFGELVAKVQASPQMLAGGFALGQQAFKAVGNELYDKPTKAKFTESYDGLKSEYGTALDVAVEAKNKNDILKFGDKLKYLEAKNLKYERYANAVTADQISMAGYTVGYALYMGTKKHNGSKLDLDPIVEICANMVSDYPEDQQKAVIQRLATFLGNHKYASDSVDDLVSKINHKMAVLADSPWVGNEATNVIKPFNNFATRLDGAKQEQVEDSWQQNEPSSNLIEAKRQSLEKMVQSEKQVSVSV